LLGFLLRSIFLVAGWRATKLNANEILPNGYGILLAYQELLDGTRLGSIDGDIDLLSGGQ
jgi:hypothetical protein